MASTNATGSDLFSAAARRLRRAPTFSMAERASAISARGKTIIHFEIGDPDFPTPPHIVAAGIAALQAGETHYGGTLPELWAAIRETTRRDLGWQPSADQVVVGPGISLIYALFQCLVNPGDEVIVATPCYPSYQLIAEFTGAVSVAVPALEANQFQPRAADVAAKMTGKTRLVIINSPCNPTGAVADATELSLLGQICQERGIYLLSDETYRLIVYGKPPPSPSAIDHCQKRTIVVNSFSKAYAMTGWRLGWAIGPTTLMEKIGLMIQTMMSTVPPFIQRAGVVALTGDQQCVREMVAAYQKRRDALVAGLNQLPGVTCGLPAGALYCFPNITGTGRSSLAFTEFALEKAGVALLPGTAFGAAGEGHVRLCFATSLENCRAGIERLRQALSHR